MKYGSAAFLLSLAFHVLIVALCLPMLADRKFVHHAIPVDFTFIDKETPQEHAAAPAATDRPVRAPQRAAARVPGIAKDTRKVGAGRVTPFEDVRVSEPPGAGSTVDARPVETGGPVTVAAAPSQGQGERRASAGPAAARPARVEGAPAAAAREGDQGAWREAVRSELRRTVDKNKVYPDRARRMNWEGTVDLSFRVFEDGSIRDITVAKGSGFRVLDDAAVDLLKRLRLSCRPAEKMRLDLAVEYRLQ